MTAAAVKPWEWTGLARVSEGGVLTRLLGIFGLKLCANTSLPQTTQHRRRTHQNTKNVPKFKVSQNGTKTLHLLFILFTFSFHAVYRFLPFSLRPEGFCVGSSGSRNTAPICEER